MSFSSPFALSKRTRDDEEQISPSGKRTRTVQPTLAVEQPQYAPPTANFASTLAQQRQEALEKMEFGAADREDIDMDGNASDGSSASNPVHPWNGSAPAMAHQASSNSLSNSSVASSSMPGTPLDGVFNYSTTSSSASYPSHSNPTSFTDMNGNTFTFASTSPPRASLAPSLSTSAAGPVSHGFVAQAYANAQAKQQQDSQSAGAIAEIDSPMRGEAIMAEDGGVCGRKSVNQATATSGYGWDYPRQSNCFAMGGHLV